MCWPRGCILSKMKSRVFHESIQSSLAEAMFGHDIKRACRHPHCAMGWSAGWRWGKRAWRSSCRVRGRTGLTMEVTAPCLVAGGARSLWGRVLCAPWAVRKSMCMSRTTHMCTWSVGTGAWVLGMDSLAIYPRMHPPPFKKAKLGDVIKMAA